MMMAKPKRRKKRMTWKKMLPRMPRGKMLVFDSSTPSGFRAATKSEISKALRS